MVNETRYAAGLLNSKQKVNKRPGDRHFVPMTQQSRSWCANSHCFPTRCEYSPGKEIVRALTIYSKINKLPKIQKKLGRSNSSKRMLWMFNLKREAPVLPKCAVVYIRLWAPPFWACFRTRFLFSSGINETNSDVYSEDLVFFPGWLLPASFT